jgi:hypothetical protein
MRTKIAKGELGQVIKLDESLAKIELDKGKQVEIELRKWPHLDYGYATEKVSPQLAQKYQILVNVETNQPDGKTKKALLELIESHKSSNAVKIYVDNQERLKNALLEAKQGLSISNPKQELVEGKESILEAKNIGLPKTKQEKLIEIYQAGIKIEKEPIVIDRQKGESIETLKETGISESTNQEISQPATLSNISEKQKATSKAIEIEM